MATMTNTNEENFGSVADAEVEITHWRMRFGSREAFLKELTTARTFAVGDPMIIEAGDLDVTLTDDDATAAWTKDLLDVYLAERSNPTVELYTDSTTEVSDSGYTEQTVEITTAVS